MEISDKDLLNHTEAKIVIDKLIDGLSDEADETEARRKLRLVDLDIASLRKSGVIPSDSTYIPQRVIHTNIGRLHPIFMTFLVGSYRLAIFRATEDPQFTDSNPKKPQLELEFTKGLTYPGWLNEFIRWADGGFAHGWDFLEVVFDKDKPLNVGFEQIGHDKVYFPMDVENFQDSEIIALEFEVTAVKLLEFIDKYDFDSEQVDIIVKGEASKNNTERERLEEYTIYKVFIKKDGVVHVAWYSRDTGSKSQEGHGSSVTDWLRKPLPYSCGISRLEEEEVSETILQGGNSAPLPSPSLEWTPVPLTEFPIFQYEYEITEEKGAAKAVGRCFLDEPTQEAMTAVLTSFVNAAQRASRTYGSPKNNNLETSSTSLSQTNITLKDGTFFNEPVEFFNPPMPDSTVLQALSYMGVANMQEAGQNDYAVSNRKDARKTAKEMEMSQKQSQQNKAVDIGLFSEAVRKVLSFAWKIVQSQALQQNIKFMLMPTEEKTDTGETVYVNDLEVIGKTFDIRPAGDVDYVERNQKITSMMQDWPIVQSTPLAQEFLKDLMRLKYPDKGDYYAEILNQGDPKKLVLALAEILKGTLDPAEIAALPPEVQQTLQQVTQQVQKVQQDVNAQQ